MNCGVWFQATLRATDVLEDQSRTIRRSADKVRGMQHLQAAHLKSTDH